MEDETSHKKRPRDEVPTTEDHVPKVTKRHTRFGPGLRGFLCTVHQRNLGLARRELEALLGRYVTEGEPDKTELEHPVSGSILDALAADLKPSVGKKFVTTQGIYPLECDTKGNLFYALEDDVLESPAHICWKALREMKVKPRNLFRLYPVLASCWSQAEYVKEMARRVFLQLAEDAMHREKEVVKVNITIHVKFHTGLKKVSSDLRCEILKMLWLTSPRFVFEGESPEVMVEIHVLKHVSTIGYSWDYTELFGYNLSKAAAEE